VIAKLNTAIFRAIAANANSVIHNKLIEDLGKTQHAVFVHEQILTMGI
jgi:hypothetical protein